MKNVNQRVAVLIDVQNMYYSAQAIYKSKVNFGAILKAAVADRQLIRAIAYGIRTEIEEEKSFFEALEKIGLEVKTKDLQTFYGGKKKADWDVGIAIDAITLAPKLDVIVLVSGDGDFIPMIQYLKINQGCRAEVIAFSKSASGKLREATDDFIDLCDDPAKYLFHDRRRRNSSPKNGK